jgi:pilus assembly protein CpaC
MYTDFHALAARYATVIIVAVCLANAANGQQATSYAQAQQGVDFRVDDSTQRLEMVVNSSRILSMDKEIPRVLVNNRELLKVVPLSSTQVQVSAVKPGVTQINLWDADGAVRSVDVVVFADSRQLEMVLQSEFPKAAIRVRPLDTSVVLAGYVDRPEAVSRIVAIAEDYYPKVINNITVGGVQQVALNVKVMEVSRTKLRALGADWAYSNGSDFIVNSAAGLISAAASGSTGVAGTGLDTIQFGIINGSDSFFGFVEALRANNLIRILAEPTLTTVSGRPASFNEGGEFPILIPQGLGVVAIEFKQFGTRVDFVPIVLGNGNIRLEVRPQVSEIDASRGVEIDGIVIPGLRSRWVDTAVEMRAGQTLALAGLIQNRTEAENRGIPFLADIPWAGNLFRRQREETNEIELLVLVRPELVGALEPHQVPALGPGEHTTSPNDVDFYGRGYLEVPKCCPDARCNPPLRNGVVPAAGVMPLGTKNGMVVQPDYQQPAAAPQPQPIPANGMETTFEAASDNVSGDLLGPSGYDSLD